MRVMLFHQYFLGENEPGGSRWNELTKYFALHHDMTIDILAGNIHYATGKKTLPNRWLNIEKIGSRVTLYRTWTYSGYNSNFFGRLLGYFSYMFSSLVKSMLLRRPDLIIVTSPSIFVGITALILSKVKRVPFIFEVRDLWPESAITTGVLQNKFLIKTLYSLERLLYKNAKRIVVLTPAFKVDIASRFPMMEDKIDVITNGVDFDHLNEIESVESIRDKYGWKDKYVFAYFGAHGLANDLEQILNVATLYKNNDKILFVLVGDGMQKGFLQTKAKEHKLDNVQFIDSVPKTKVNDYIRASNICLATLKKTDTFKTIYPNKVFDYMSCKKPVLITIDGITRELVNRASCGLYSPPEDLESLKQMIETFVLMSKNELDQMGHNGYQYVKENFNRENLSFEYLNIIEESR